jgi:hypothetical protein
MAKLELDILEQPDDVTCGPTSLHAVYRYHGDRVGLDEVIRTVRMLGDDAGRGTHVALLGAHARRRGYQTRIYSFNMGMFDPTWFPEDGRPADNARLAEKLSAQRDTLEESIRRRDVKFEVATEAYLEYLELGGEVCLTDLTSRLMLGYLKRGMPILAGLSSTFLYRNMREWGATDEADDIRGVPQGHFVVVSGYDPSSRKVTVLDPMGPKTPYADHRYDVTMARLVGAILLGVLTYEANLLILTPGGRGPSGVSG